MPFPNYSPWGKVQTSKKLCEDIYQVSTAGHGGVMVLRTAVDKLLSPAAQQYGFVDGPWHCYEEDCDALIPIRELLDKGLYQAPVNQYYGPGEYSEAIDSSLKYFRPRYWVLYQKAQSEVKFDLRTMTKPEQMYCYAQSQQISKQSGLIGYLRGEIDEGGNTFMSRFFSFREDLESDAFEQEKQELLDNLLDSGFLEGRKVLEEYCRSHPECNLGTGSEFGVRVDTSHYTYMMRLNPTRSEDNIYMYCYVRQWLERHMGQAEKGIRFITPSYEEKFRIADGDSIRIIRHDGEQNDQQCRYIDEAHFEMGAFGTGIFHICQFAEKCAETGVQAVIPLRASLPEQCYSNLLETGAVVILKKGETGYYKADIPVTDKASAIALVEEYNRKLGVSPAQFEAMKAGSMFGFHVPAADPKNYDEQGQPICPKQKDRGDAR